MDFHGLYSDTGTSEQAKARIKALCDAHEVLFSSKADKVFSSPGRTEIIGNHTDHNLGKVIAGAICLDTLAAVHKRNDNTVRLVSEGFEAVEMSLDDLSVRQDEKNTTASLVRGIAACFAEKDIRLCGFDANLTSLVKPGSGLSSSASVEVLLAKIFSYYCADDSFTPTDLAVFGKKAENTYFGKPSGLMDQLACACGGLVAIDFENETNPLVTPLSIDFQDYGYNLLIIQTPSDHADLTDDYAAIPSDMKQIASLFGKKVLRELKLKDIKDLPSSLKKDRAVHFFEENMRVDRMIDAIRNRDFETYLSLVNESGRSSEQKLRNIVPGNLESNAVSRALEKSKELLNGKGATRIHGGGFAGTIAAYVPVGETENYIAQMEKLCGKGCCTKASIRQSPVTVL